MEKPKVHNCLRARLCQRLDRVLMVAPPFPEIAVVQTSSQMLMPTPPFNSESANLNGSVTVFVEDLHRGQQGQGKACPTAPSFSSTALLNNGRPTSEGLGVANPSRGGASLRSLAMEGWAQPRRTKPIHQQAARQVSHQGQLGSDHQVRAAASAARGCPDNQRGVPCGSPAVVLI
jgi:hypothetical protein